MIIAPNRPAVYRYGVNELIFRPNSNIIHTNYTYTTTMKGK